MTSDVLQIRFLEVPKINISDGQLLDVLSIICEVSPTKLSAVALKEEIQQLRIQEA
jgi:hypothetical protein